MECCSTLERLLTQMPAKVEVTTSIAAARPLATPSITTCQSKQVIVGLKNPTTGIKETQFLAIDTPGN